MVAELDVNRQLLVNVCGCFWLGNIWSHGQSDPSSLLSGDLT